MNYDIGNTNEVGITRREEICQRTEDKGKLTPEREDQRIAHEVCMRTIQLGNA